MPYFATHNYTPLFNLKKTDFIDLSKAAEVFIPFGEDNNLPSQLNKLAREVPVHRAIINAKVNYIMGKGLQSKLNSINHFLENPNNTDNNFSDTFKKVVTDYLIQGNAYIEIITDAKKSFLYLYHTDAAKCRISTDLTQILIHPNWEEFKNKNDEFLQSVPLYPNFTRNAKGLYHSIYHIREYAPEFFYYGLCSYFPGLRSIIITGLTNIWNQRRLENHFSIEGMLIVPGVNDDSDAEALDAEFSKLFGSNPEASTDIIIQYLSDLSPGTASQAAQYIPFTKNEEGNWMALHQQAELSLITIHNWFRTLTPYSDDKAGFDKNKIIAEYEIAMSTIIKPMQEMFMRHLKKIITQFIPGAFELEFINEPPVQRINPYNFVWEVRRDSGLDYDPNDPMQRQLVIAVRNTYGLADDMKDSLSGQRKAEDASPPKEN